MKPPRGIYYVSHGTISHDVLHTSGVPLCDSICSPGPDSVWPRWRSSSSTDLTSKLLLLPPSFGPRTSPSRNVLWNKLRLVLVDFQSYFSLHYETPSVPVSFYTSVSCPNNRPTYVRLLAPPIRSSVRSHHERLQTHFDSQWSIPYDLSSRQSSLLLLPSHQHNTYLRAPYRSQLYRSPDKWCRNFPCHLVSYP